MRYSNSLIPTVKETPADAQVASHRLMIRAGLIRKESAGIYSYLPLGFKVLRKIENIIEEEMDQTGAQRLLLPILTSHEYWQKSGRWHTMGLEMMRLKDRHDHDFVLGPTHEEAVTNLVAQTTFSYRDLPLNLYQMHTKFRDEMRPRFGVIRGREFIMKDAYSFDLDENGLNRHYELMRRAYRRIFFRVGLDTLPVEADVGAMGGSGSEEFMILSDIGEEQIVYCPVCQYRANREQANRQEFTDVQQPEISVEDAIPETPVKVHTPDIKTIDQLETFFGLGRDHFLKCVVYQADKQLVSVFIRGDLDINDIKLKNYLQAIELDPATEEAIRSELGMEPGYIGPIGNRGRMVFDTSVRTMQQAIVGGGDKNVHLRHVICHRDFPLQEIVAIHLVGEKDPCPNCGESLQQKPGIELGHIFKLGKKYSQAMGVSILAEDGKPLVPIMGCYGIGVTRTMAAVIEQHHDNDGITWPISIAPYEIGLISLVKKPEELQMVERIYQQLIKASWQVLFDDRNLSPGIKFKDMDLIGLPIKIIFGKNSLQKQSVEIKIRKTGQVHETAISQLLTVLDPIRQQLWQDLLPGD